MLQVIVPQREFFDETKQEFVFVKEETFQLEHSLVSLAKWEAKWCKPFLGKDEKTTEETLDYIRCMTITQNVSLEVYNYLPPEVQSQIMDYINAPMTATWFSDDKGPKGNREIITAEVIYYWMIAQTIPMECQKWHLNRLLTLIKVCSIKSAPPKKRGRKEMMNSRTALNEARRNAMNSKG